MICMLIIVNVCREYMYRGRVESQEVDTLKGVFLAANMLQMTDLELLTVHKLHKLCNLANCLDMSVLLEYFSTCKGTCVQVLLRDLVLRPGRPPRHLPEGEESTGGAARRTLGRDDLPDQQQHLQVHCQKMPLPTRGL